MPVFILSYEKVLPFKTKLLKIIKYTMNAET